MREYGIRISKTLHEGPLESRKLKVLIKTRMRKGWTKGAKLHPSAPRKEHTDTRPSQTYTRLWKVSNPMADGEGKRARAGPILTKIRGAGI